MRSKNTKPPRSEQRSTDTNRPTQEWLEEDRREEWLALSVLCALRKVS